MSKSYAQLRVYEQTRQRIARIAEHTKESIIVVVDRLVEKEIQALGLPLEEPIESRPQ